MRLLITGSSGIIGTRLFERHIEHDYRVTGVDLSENRWSSQLNERTIRADLLRVEEFKKLSMNAELTAHLATKARLCSILKSPQALENRVMTLNTLEFARKNKRACALRTQRCKLSIK